MAAWSDLNCAYLVKAYAALLHIASLVEKISPPLFTCEGFFMTSYTTILIKQNEELKLAGFLHDCTKTVLKLYEELKIC